MHHTVCYALFITDFVHVNGANYKHSEIFLQTSLSSHVTVSSTFFLAVIKQFLTDVSWRDLDHQIVDTPLHCTCRYDDNLISEACDVLMCEVQWPSDQYHTLWITYSI